MGLPLLVLLVGCSQTTPEPVPDFVTYTPKYVDVVTAKMDQTTSGLTEVKSAVQENTEVLLQIKELVAQKPAAGGVEPRETPSSQESSPPPAPPYWETDAYYVQYYGATWCGPCRTVKPRLKKVMKKYGLDQVYREFDVDEHKAETKKAGVSSVPVIIICRKGKQIDRLTGSHSEKNIEAFFQKYLQPTAAMQTYQKRDLVRLHDDIHNAESGLNTTWTWEGDLKTHLERDHGVEL